MTDDSSGEQKQRRVPALVGIGASAGGLEALSELLKALPPATGLSYLIVQHLDRTHVSGLAEILAKSTRMPVVRAQNGLALQPNHAYVITPNTSMTVFDGHLLVTNRTEAAGHHMPIDALFTSLASEHHGDSIAIVLSGTGSDGALGIEAVKGEGGITFAQDPATTQFDGMPTKAIATGCVDFVLSPEDIARELERIAQHPYLTGLSTREALVGSQQDWTRLFRLLQTASGVDFSHYKRNTLHRRLVRRLALKRIDRIADYIGLLQESPDELEALYQDLLIRVTRFFRDEEAFAALAGEVFPRIVARRARREALRIWVPACASGEEVYSVAMIALEYFDGQADAPALQIFGTDVNARAIERARAGRFIENIALDVSDARLQRFFTKQGERYEISKSVRDMCIFAQHNVTRDPPFSKLDLVTCRNLLIYLDQATQRRMLGVFHYALNPDGYLMLGASENIGHSSELFEPIDKKQKLFRRCPTPARVVPEFPLPERKAVRRPKALADTGSEPVYLEQLQREADRQLLDRFVPAGVIIDDRCNVLQFRGHTSPFLEHQQGAASLQLSKLIRPDLLVEVANAIEECRASGKAVRRERLHVEVGARAQLVNVEVIPILDPATTGRFYAVTFQTSLEEGASGFAEQGVLSRWFGAGMRPGRAVRDEAAERLETQLKATRHYLQETIEANEAAQEELRAANEEVLSANEEFQSTNEELETAKEELQSANEELATTNDELRNRNVELSVVNQDVRKARDHAQRIVETVGIPLLVLDASLRVRQANRAYYEAFRTGAAEVEGRLFGDLAEGGWRGPDLVRVLRGVLMEGAALDGREVMGRFPRAGERRVRLSARRLADDNDQGELVLLTVDDVTERSRSAVMLRQQADLLDQAHDAILVWELGGPIRYWNRGAKELYGWTADEAVGKSSDELLRTERSVGQSELESALSTNERWSGEQTHLTRDGRRIVVEGQYTLVRREGASPLVLETNRDVSERKQMEESLRTEASRKDEFLAMLAHELRNPLAPVRNALHLLRDNSAPADERIKLNAMIERQVGRLARIVDDLLDVSRISHGIIELRKESTDLVTLMRNACETTRYRFESLNHELRVRLPDRPVHALVDATRVEQIVVNLLDNAAKYSPPGSKIHLSLDRAGNDVSICVRDNGSGISSELLPHVFDLFKRGGDPHRAQGGGLGIGLALVRRLAELHGGSVMVRSAGEGRGSEFVVRLPSAMEAATGDVPAAEKATHQAVPDGRKRVLIVDDNADSANSLALLAKMWGHDVMTAGDGPSALEAAETFGPHVVLLDIGLPGMSGYEVAARLRAMRGSQLRIIAVTGYGSAHDRQASRKADIDQHLVKPVDVDALEEFLDGPLDPDSL